jgi:hypothetical protein
MQRLGNVNDKGLLWTLSLSIFAFSSQNVKDTTMFNVIVHLLLVVVVVVVGKKRKTSCCNIQHTKLKLLKEMIITNIIALLFKLVLFI